MQVARWKDQPHPKKKVVRIVFTLALALLAAFPFILFPPSEPLTPSGPYSVARVRYTYTDEQRIEQYANGGEMRRVNVVFWYPTDASSPVGFPLIVSSHGGLSTENSNESLFIELASHGYVVCSIGHPYHTLWTKDDSGKIIFVSREYFGELQRENAKTDKKQIFRYYQKWMETRTADINLVINTVMAKIADGEGGVYALVDGERIGVMGHSLGGSAALAIPRQRNEIGAVVALESPYLYNIVDVKNNEFVWLSKAYPAPVLNIYSDSSWDHLSTWQQYAQNADLLSNAPENANSLYLPGAGHFSLTDLALTSPLLTRLLEGGQPNLDPEGYLREVNRACLEFFDRHLKSSE